MQGLKRDFCKPKYFLYDNALGNAQAIKQVIAWEVAQKMANEGISKTEMAKLY